VLDRAGYRFNVEVHVKGLKSSVDELSTIIGYDGVGDSEPTYNASPYKILDILRLDGSEGLDLGPFGEIVDSDQEKLCLPIAWAEGTITQMANGHGDTIL